MTYAAVSEEDAREHRNMRYAMKFVSESSAEPDDTALAAVLANCGRPARPGEYPFIRRHVHTFRDGVARGQRDVKGQLLDRAESYSRDAQRFADMPKLGFCDPRAERYVSEEDCKHYAAMYCAIADELRKVAATL